jgi:hypothetical protein
MINKNKFQASLVCGLIALGASGCGLEAGNDNDSVIDTDIGNDNRVDNSVRWEPRENTDSQDDDQLGKNPDCSAGINGADGSGGFLWKPVSESDGALVVLFPAAYDVEFERVEAELAGGSSVEAGEFAGFTNGNRQTWRFNEEGKEYSGMLFVYDEAQDCTWQVSTPAQRVD